MAKPKLYKTRPKTVYAMQWTGYNVASVMKYCFGCVDIRTFVTTDRLIIRNWAHSTSEFIVRKGDYILKDAMGFSTCDTEAFESKYELVDL